MSYNTSDNSTVIQTNLNSSISSYTVSSEPGVTYYITVRAVNAVGPGDINGYSIVNGEIMITYYYSQLLFSKYSVPLKPTIISTTSTTNILVQSNPVLLSNLISTNQDTSIASCKFILFVITVVNKHHSCRAGELFELFTITICSAVSGWEWIYCYW